MPNEFADAAQQVIGGDLVVPRTDGENDYRAAARQMVDDSRVQLKASTSTAMDVDPERHAKVLALAGKTKLPTSVVQDQFDLLDKRVRVSDADLGGIQREHPHLGEWLSDHDNAAIAHDDLPVLKAIDYAVRSLVAPNDDPSGLLPSGFRFSSNGTIIEPYGYGYANEYKTVQDLQAELRRRGEKQGLDQLARIEQANLLREQFGPFANVAAGAKSSAASTLGMLQVDPNRQNEVAAYGDEATAASQEISPGFFGDLQRGAGGLAADLPLMFLGGPVAKATGSLLKLTRARAFIAPVLGPKAARYVAGAAEVAGAVQPLAIREGMDTARDNSALDGLMAWAIETVIPAGFGKTGVERAIIGDSMKRLGPAGWAPVAKRLAFEIGAEGAEEATTELAHALHEYASGIDEHALDAERLVRRLSVAGVLGGAAGGAFNLPGAVAEKFHLDAMRADRAERDAAMLERAGLAIAESATGKRSPERLQALVKAAGGDGSTVFFQSGDWQEYWQEAGASPEGIAKALGVNADSYQVAVASGSQIAVPLSSYLSMVGPTEHFKALHGKSRLSADGMSLDEATAWKKNAPKFLQEAAAAAKTGDRAPDPVVGDVVNQLISAGYSEQKAQDSAAGFSMFQNIADKWGSPMNAMEEFKKYDLNIQREGAAPTGTAIAEAAQEFGQPARDANVKRGSLRISEGRRFTITLNKSADPSTFIHEFGHFALEVMGDFAQREDAPQSIKDDYRKILNHFAIEERGEIGREHHEIFARSFEAYIYTGKAPSSALRSAFARLSEWIKSVYKSLLALKVDLTPELRGVFDRMIASDDEIAAAQAEEAGSPLFIDAKSAGMTEDQFAAYAKQVEQVALSARESLRAEIMDELKREERSWWKAERAQIEAEVTKDVNSRKEYIAIAVLSKGTMPDGSALPDGVTAIKLNKKLVTDDFDVDLVKRLPRGVTTSQDGYGVSPEAAAELFGYRSGPELVNAIANALPRKQAIHDETDAAMLREHGDMRFNGEAATKATEAIHGEERARVVMEELKALRRLQQTVQPIVKQAVGEAVASERTAQEAAAYLEAKKAKEDVANEKLVGEAKVEQVASNALLDAQIALMKAAMVLDNAKGQIAEVKADAKADRKMARGAVRSIPPLEMFRSLAKQAISSMIVRDINPKAYLAAARKASRDAFTAMSKGDYGVAADHKQREILNNELFSEASKAKTAIDKAVKAMRRLDRPDTRARLGKAGADYLERIDEIMDRYEFRNASLRQLNRRNGLREWLATVEAEGRAHGVPQEVIDDARQVNYQELPFEFLMSVRDAAKSIQHLAATKHKLLKAQDEREYAEAVAGAIATITANVPPLPPAKIAAEAGWSDKQWRRIEGWAAAHRKLSSYARQMDGGAAGGPMQTLLVRGLNDSADAEVTGRKEAALIQHELWSAWSASGAQLSDRVMVPAINQALNRESRLMVALNWGNEGNRDRLKTGEQWNDAQVQAILETLDAADWTLVQGIWKQIDAYWPQIVAKQKRVTGLAPEKVEAASFETSSGTMPGGYFPIAYDGQRSPRAANNEAAGAAKLYMLGDATRATTKRGHVEARSGGLGKPLKLSLDVVAQHLSQVIHDLTHHETIIDLNRLLNDDELTTTIQNHLGPAALREMRKIVKDVAVSDLAENDVDRTLRWIRNGVSTATLGFSFSTALTQIAGIPQSMQLVGVRNFFRASKRIFSDATKMENTFKWVRGKSSFMNNRGDSFIREAFEVLNQVKGGAWKENLQRWSHYMTLKMQTLVDMPTWLAAYESAQQNGREEKDAVADADQAVIDSQGSGMVKDLAGVQRSRVTQLFTVFYSFWNTTFNRSAEAIATARRKKWSPEAIAQLGLDFLLLYSIPAAIMVAIRRGMRDDDKEERNANLGAELLKEHLSMFMSTVVGVREFADPLSKLIAHGTGKALGAKKLPPSVTDIYDYAGPAGTIGFDAISNLLIQMNQGELDEGLIKAVAKALGPWTHLPATQAIRLIDGFLYDQQHGTADPRPLLFGPATKK